MTKVKGYAKGVAFLTMAALFVKVLSMVYRVPFQNLVGDQGFFIYQQVYPFVAVFMTWTSSGLAIAVSKMIADELGQPLKRQQAISQLLYRALWVFSILLFIGMYSASDFFARAMGDEQLGFLLKIGSLVIFTVPTLSMYKGKLQAHGNLQTVAVMQVIEQVVRVTVILGGTAYVMATSQSLYTAGAVAVLGTVSGEWIGVLLLMLYMRKKRQSIYLLNKENTVVRKREFLKKMLVVSVSASMSSLLLIFFQIVDAFTVFDTLVQYIEQPIDAMKEKGIYDRGQPLVQVGLVIATSFSMAIVPIIASAMKKRKGEQMRQLIRVTFQATLLFGVAATVGLMLVMPYLNKALFETTDLSDVLSVYVIQIIMLSMIMAITAILQGLGYRKGPTYILAISLLIKILITKPFVHYFGIVGAAWSSNLALIVGACSLVYYLKKKQDIQLASRLFYQITGYATVCMVFVVGGIRIFDEILAIDSRLYAAIMMLFLVIIGGSIFILCITRYRIFTVKEWLLLPLGSKMAALQLFLNRK